MILLRLQKLDSAESDEIVGIQSHHGLVHLFDSLTRGVCGQLYNCSLPNDLPMYQNWNFPPLAPRFCAIVLDSAVVGGGVGGSCRTCAEAGCTA